MMRIRTTRLLAGVLGAFGLLVLGTVRTEADVITHLNSVQSVPGGFNWNYAPNVTVDQKVSPGDYFVIQDFQGYNGTHSEPAGWTLVTPSIGPTPTGVMTKDDPTIPDLVWKYDGTGSAPSIAGPASLGQFTAGSTIGAKALGWFVSQGTRSTGVDAGTKISNIGQENIPFSAPAPAGSEVPEPTTLALFGIGLPLAIAAGRRRRRTMSA
jgi:hypothetical protein